MEECYTKTDEHNIVFKWKINKIDVYVSPIIISDTDLQINSSEFTSGAKIKDKWRMELDFNNSNTNNTTSDKLDFRLRLLNNDDLVNTKFSFFILSNKNEKQCLQHLQFIMKKCEETLYSLSKSELLKNKDKFLPGNILTVCVDLTAYDPPITTFKKIELNISKCPMAQDYKKLYESGMGTDVTITVDDTHFLAHRNILMARSPVLGAMFSHEMIEKKENKITIPNITPDIFEKVMEYIYTDEVSGLAEIADDLLKAADKYQILSLKNICQESLSETLNLENAFELMTLADRHSAEPLLEFITDFLVNNIKKNNIDIEDFENFEKSHSSLAFKVMKKYSFSKNEDKANIPDKTSK
ncbi:speckle-type POZ protein-like isoform X2 [Microplitis mediator]|nr:speckle-type POZ protein-like isoform X2 [Microplitis mediator]